jgi:hypothetical protein
MSNILKPTVMKTQILTVLSIVLLGIASVSSANYTVSVPVNENDSTVECIVYIDNNGFVTLRMVKSTDEPVKVNLYDAYDNLLVHRRYTKAHNVKLQYDLSQSPVGPYRIMVKAGKEVVYTATVVNTGDLIVDN